MPIIPDLLAEPDEPTDWLCEPFIVKGGITFLHADTSVGKSPLSWEAGRCLDQGLPFFGHPTRACRVWYLEADTAQRLVKPRLRCIRQPYGSWRIEDLYGYPADLTLWGSSIFTWLTAKQKEWGIPDFVVWNTLERFLGDDASLSSSETVRAVYRNLTRALPMTAHWINAHNRKDSTNPEAKSIERESFLGSKAWISLATVGLRLQKRAGHIDLITSKSQVGPSEPEAPVVQLILESDTKGARLHLKSQERETAIRAAMAEVQGNQEDRVAHASLKLGLSRATIFRALETGKQSKKSSS